MSGYGHQQTLKPSGSKTGAVKEVIGITEYPLRRCIAGCCLGLLPLESSTDQPCAQQRNDPRDDPPPQRSLLPLLPRRLPLLVLLRPPRYYRRDPVMYQLDIRPMLGVLGAQQPPVLQPRDVPGVQPDPCQRLLGKRSTRPVRRDQLRFDETGSCLAPLVGQCRQCVVVELLQQFSAQPVQ